jgi:hypothetical protein
MGWDIAQKVSKISEIRGNAAEKLPVLLPRILFSANLVFSTSL